MGLLLAIASGSQMKAQSSTSLDAYVEGVVRVKLQREVATRISNSVLPMSASGYMTTGVTTLDRVNEKVKAVSMKRVFPYSPKYEERHKAFGLDLWYDITFEGSGITVSQAKNLYKAAPGVTHAGAVAKMKPIGGESFREITPSEIAKASKAAATMPFNDPLLSSQWHYHNDGSINGSVAGADINAFEAWQTAGVCGSSDVLVAIIDGGFQVDHPDLAQNAYVNEAELNGQPGVDDDGNGYVDDVYGYNFVTSSSDISAHSHGTHVAGTVGAVNNNGIGVAGVAGGNGSDQTGVKMLVCQVFDSRTSADGNFADALVYAADMGASIAQCSWGQSSADYEDASITEAVKYFTQYGGGDKMSGGLCIFAAGNTQDEGNYYPQCLDEVVAVGAMTNSKEPAYYSTRGSWVDVTAPGGLEDYGEENGVLSTLPNSTYGYNEGTSMACPHVSGIAALVLSKYGNSQFTNETLRTLLTSSVNDLYTDNPSWEGLMGSGYIDAYKALQVSQGSTPTAVTEYTLTPSHDNVLVEWIIPESDEGIIDHHVIYYSTTEFTAESDLTKLNSVSVDTKFMASGDTMSYELDGLSAETTYYFAIKTYNRWGTGSELSPIQSATTNAGPVISFDKTSLSMTIDATSSTTASDEFVISNTGAGVLKYSISAATKSVSISRSSRNEVSPGNVVPFSGSVAMKKASSNTVVSSDYYAGDYPKEMAWTSGIYAYIGESDTSKPNALAQLFVVDEDSFPNGFNLTALNFGGAYGSDPVIEIYDGSRSISTASLLQTVDYSYFAYNYDINLGEQIYFEPGSSFWVVAKYPAGQTYPLGMGTANTSNIQQYSYFSTDNGSTWMQLNEALSGSSYESVADNMTWDVTAISKNPDWSAVLNPNPAEGQVRSGESQTVTMSNDGQQLVNGTYNFNLVVSTNESQASDNKLSVKMTVSGYKPSLSSQQLVDFGDLLVGQEKTLTIELSNSGFGAFTGRNGGSLYASSGNIACTSDQFEMPSYMSAIAARSTGSMDVTFKPTAAGSVSGRVTLTDKNGNTYSFTVRGVASDPAKVSVDKDTLDFEDLDVSGESKSLSFNITNEGQYPLEYVFPKYSSETIDGIGTVHKFGYSYISNLNGSDAFSYDNNPDLTNETDITSTFNDNTWQSSAINLGFSFPFYGTNYDQIYVTSYGSVIMNNSDYARISCNIPTADCVSGYGYISAYVNADKLAMGSDSKISYGKQDGKFVIKFKDVLTYALEGGDARTKVSFHMALCSDGSVEVYYDDYDPYSVYGSGMHNFVGISDVDCEDPFVVTDYDYAETDDTYLYQSIMTGSAIKIVAPASSMIESISSTDGVIGIGESAEITVTASAANENLYAGELTNYLTLLTNDPSQPSTTITLKANITGDGLVPVASLDSTSVNFGEVFRTSDTKASVLLSNKGRSALNVSSVTAKEGKVVLEDEVQTAFTVAAGEGKDITITLPTETEGAVSDEVVIAYADGTTASIPVTGTVIGVPEWNITPESITETTPYGESISKELTVTNSGNEALVFDIEPETWFNVTDLTTDDNSSIGYSYKSSSENDDVTYSWVDITSDYDGHWALTDYLDVTDFATVELPFSFPFYGKNYTTMYIYDTGFVSFSEHTDYVNFPEPPAQLPTSDTFYTNIIAPFWGNHSMGSSSTDGAYYKAEEDRVIVSYIGYGNSAMDGMNYQVIINNDGTFKFQYNLDDTGFMLGVYGVAGVQDETGTTGVNLASQYITSGNAVLFSPVKSYTVAAGESKVVPVELLADDLADTYEREIIINTNVPTSPVVTVPVSMTITGEAVAVFPDSVGGELVADYVTGWKVLTYDFEVANTGSKAFKITNVSFNDDYSMDATLMVYTTYEDEWFGGTTTGWTTWYPGLEVTVGKEPVQFQLVAYDYGTPMTMEAPIVFTLDGLSEETKTVPFRLVLTDAPLMTFDRDEIVIDGVSKDYTGTDSLIISNEGQYKLTYSLRLDPSGNDEVSESEDTGGDDPGIMWAPKKVADGITTEFNAEMISRNAISAMSKSAPAKVEDSNPYIYDVPSGIEYTNLLYYPILKPVSNAQSAIIGTGSDTTENYYAATRYVSPDEGFNLSHLYFVGTIGNLENVDIEASVVIGDDVTSDNVVGTGTLHVDKEEPTSSGNYYGEPRLLEFDSPIYINPADTFYVILKYPAGYTASALMASKNDEVSANRYMGYIESMGGWFDVEDYMDSYYSTGAFGYFMTCVETEEGSSWIKMLNSTTEGEVAVGESLAVKFDIDASKAYYDKNNKATLVIKSNDPASSLVNYHITLNRNSAPVITAPSGTTTVPEASTALMTINVADEEGDAFTVDFTDESSISSIDSYENADGTQEGISIDGTTISVEAGYSLNVNLLLAPDYGTEGQHSVVVTAVDANNNTATSKVAYNVEHTNQAPEYVGPASLVFVKGETSSIYDYSTLFTDPDDDEMTYEVSVANSSIATIFNASTGFIISAVSEGTTTLTISATDANGARTDAPVSLTVTSTSGISNAKIGNGDVSVDGDGNAVTITVNADVENAQFRIFDAAGSLVAQLTVKKMKAGESRTIELNSSLRGVFNVVSILDGKASIVKLAKVK